MGKNAGRGIGLAVLWAGALLGFAGPAGALPPNFVDQLVTNVGAPTALAFTPDGRLLITTQGGALRVFAGGTLLPTPALTFPASQICTNFERGLLGVAVDPDFTSNNYIYLFYTFRNGATPQCSGSAAPKNRVSRFVLPPGNVVAPASETVLVDNMPSPNGNHNGGDVQFGKDGYLYIAVGDGGCDYAGGGCAGANDASRDQHTLTGKILRVTADGGIPADNPFQGPGTERCHLTGGTIPGNRCQETFAWGLRNPFRMAFDANAAATVFRINDVGQNQREEIDHGQAGADYGWNCREGTRVNNTGGPCNPAPAGMVDPIYEYSHGLQIPGTTSPTSCNAITGGAFIPNGIWPAAFDNSYLFSDYTCGWVVHLGSGPLFTAQDFATNLGASSVVAMLFGPYQTTQALYYTTFAGGGQVRRVFYSVGGNNPPTAVAGGSPLGGPLPLAVTFDASGSSDPDPGNTLTYLWDFGDGSAPASTTSLTVPHTYTTAGPFTVSLRARDNSFAFSAPVTLTVHPGNHLPVPSISVPTPAQTFSVGQVVTLTGSGTDNEDGPLPGNRLSWTVLLHHNTHTHPFLGPVTGSTVDMTCPAPEDLAATDTSYLEIRLTATDLDDLSQTIVQNFQPLKVPITVATAPAGLVIPVNGFSQAGPSTFTSWAGYVLNVDAPDQSVGPIDYTWVSWSDAGARAHAITTPAVPTTYTATFQGNGAPVPVISVPTTTDTFSVGQVVPLTGSATDPEDGTLASDRLSWTVLVHHDAHTHPLLGPVSGSPVLLTAPAPEDLPATDNSYLEIRLMATDSDGRSATLSQSFQPLKVPITIETAPPGLVVPVNGVNQTGPSTFTSWAGYGLNVDAPDQLLGGNSYAWASWSDGGARAHTITTPPTATTYTATFQQNYKYYTLTPCRLVDTRNAVGPLGGPALASGASRDFDLDGTCSVPATAKALAVNVTVAQPSAIGDLRIYPQGSPPTTTSAINFRAGRARANNAVVGLGPTGALSVFCAMGGAGTTHFILDVVGYFQ